MSPVQLYRDYIYVFEFQWIKWHKKKITQNSVAEIKLWNDLVTGNFLKKCAGIGQGGIMLLDGVRI